MFCVSDCSGNPFLPQAKKTCLPAGRLQRKARPAGARPKTKILKYPKSLTKPLFN